MRAPWNGRMSDRPQVFVTFPLPVELAALRDAPYVLHWGEGRPPELDVATAASVRAIVTNGIKGASAELMDAFPNLELVASLGIGLDAIDLGHARERGIVVTNTPGVTTDDVADLAMWMIGAAFRNLLAGNRYLEEGRWPEGPFPLARSLTGKSLGIVGLGAIGSAVARRADAHRMLVRWTGPREKADAPWPFISDLRQLAEQSDVLVVACAGGGPTRHLVDARVMQALGPTGILVNIARGSIVDSAALVAALDSGRLGGAALDVFEAQPQVPMSLLNRQNVLLTPHMGSATRETRSRMGELVVQSLADHFSGRMPAHRVA